MAREVLTIGINKKTFYSKIATHPGEILKDEIEARELTKKNVAHQLEIQPGYLSDLFGGKRNISVMLALKLEKLLGISAEFWLNLQNRHDITIIRQQRPELVSKKPLKFSQPV